MIETMIKPFRFTESQAGKHIECFFLVMFILAAIPFCALAPLSWIFDFGRFREQLIGPMWVVALMVVISGSIIIMAESMRHYILQTKGVYDLNRYSFAGTMRFVFVRSIFAWAILGLMPWNAIHIGLFLGGLTGIFFIICFLGHGLWILLDKWDYFAYTHISLPFEQLKEKFRQGIRGTDRETT